MFCQNQISSRSSAINRLCLVCIKRSIEVTMRVITSVWREWKRMYIYGTFFANMSAVIVRLHKHCISKKITRDMWWSSVTIYMCLFVGMRHLESKRQVRAIYYLWYHHGKIRRGDCYLSGFVRFLTLFRLLLNVAGAVVAENILCRKASVTFMAS